MYFIGAAPADNIFNFYPSDTEKLFKKNRKKLGKDWFWHNGPKITYNINNDGFRMNKDFKDVNFDNYFLSIGCSFAFGIGMPHEELYTTLIAEEINTDAVLLANPGNGMDTFFHNFFAWMENYGSKLPKFIILSHAPLDRKTFYVENGNTSMQTSQMMQRLRKRSFLEYLKYEIDEIVDYRLKHIAIKKYCQSVNIPLIEFTCFPDSAEKLNLDLLFFREDNDKLPLARDWNWPGVHPGYSYQNKVYNYVLEKINNEL